LRNLHLSYSFIEAELKVKKTFITNEIRRLRFENGEMTQKDLAIKVGVTRQTIVAIENSKYSPTLEVAFKIANVFKTDINTVFGYNET